MKRLFADTFFFLALLVEDDECHDAAVKIISDLEELNIVTTSWVLTEVADGLASRGWRSRFLDLLQLLRRQKGVTIIPPQELQFNAGLDLYAKRSDKRWSLTDCISFSAMTDLKITHALTGDHHFEQAGFVAMIK